MSLFDPIHIVTQPTLDVITITEAKQHLKVDHDDEDTLLSLYVKGCVKCAEDYRQSAIMSTQYELWTDQFYSPISLQKHPVSAINSVKYYDEDNTLQTVSSSDYILQYFKQPCALEFTEDFDYPDVHSRQFPVVVNFNAGYLAASSVPATIKLGILNQLGNQFEFRQWIQAGAGLSAIEIKGSTMEILNSETMWI